jgi:hypothetical protein
MTNFSKLALIFSSRHRKQAPRLRTAATSFRRSGANSARERDGFVQEGKEKQRNSPGVDEALCFGAEF